MASRGAVPQRQEPPRKPLILAGPPFSIDVECVATGPRHNDRAVAQIAMVDNQGNTILNIFVKPEEKVVSYLGELTGLSKGILDQHGINYNEAVRYVRQFLPKNAVLVGVNISKDINWLGLREGEDFQALVDLGGLYRVWNTRYNSFTLFGLDHLAKVALGVNGDGQAHNALTDATKSIHLLNRYLAFQENPAILEKLLQQLLAVPVAPSFKKKYPTYEGCCMGDRKTCTCGAPFIF